MRKLGVALAAAGVTVFGFAAPAQADEKPLNYGHCVTDFHVDPSNPLSLGPLMINPQGDPVAWYTADDHSGGQNRWDSATQCENLRP